MLGPVLETLIGGLMTGVLYSLVALGFVLIFKASGVFNFAQGAMVLFAALSFARLSEAMPLVFAFALLRRDPRQPDRAVQLSLAGKPALDQIDSASACSLLDGRDVGVAAGRAK